MNIKTLFKAMSIKARKSRAFSKKFVKSYVSLFVVLILGMTSTIAWFTKNDDAEIKALNLEFQSASSLRINKDKSVSNNIKIDEFVLDEASSVDGRNIYFPLGASFTEDTENMFFREGNKGDENKRYIYKDFELKGTSGNTPVYIKGYQIKISDPKNSTPHDTEINGVYEDELVINYDNKGVPLSQTLPPDCPIRLAFIADSGEDPVVIDPSAMVIDYVENSDAVTLIDDSGNPMTEGTDTDSFASYYYGKKPLFVIPSGQNLPVTLVVWLEGSLGNCNKYIGKQISIDIDIESNFAEMEEIKFVDGTKPDNDGGQEHWVSNDNPIIACSYKDPFSDEGRWKTIIMSKSINEAYTWTAEIPKKAVTDIAFFRLNKAGDGEPKGTIYNSWRTAENITAMLGKANIPNNWYRSGSPDLQPSRQMFDSDGNKYNALIYTAVRGNGHSITNDSDKRLSPCVGYWNYESSGSSGGDTGNTNPTQPSSGSSSATYEIGVYVNTKDWVEQNASSGSVLHCVTDNGRDYTLNHSGNKYFSGTFTMETGDKINGFYLLYPGGSKSKIYSVIPRFTVSRNYNVTFTMNNDDTFTPSATS